MLKKVVLLLCAVVLATAPVALAATINGTNGPDFLVGTNDNDTIRGFAGNDIIFCLSGNDFLDGGEGNDFIVGDGTCPPGAPNPSYCSTSGGSGNDRIRGRSGNDFMLGGDGNDHIDGDSGNDVIHGQNGDPEALSFEPLGRMEDGVVLDGRDHDVAPPA
jgi:Ca2+-binding RTX toxin-like protein